MKLLKSRENRMLRGQVSRRELWAMDDVCGNCQADDSQSVIDEFVSQLHERR